MNPPPPPTSLLQQRLKWIKTLRLVKTAKPPYHTPKFQQDIKIRLCQNLLTSISDQDRISPFNISTILNKQVMRIWKSTNKGLSVDPMPNSPN